MDIRGLLDRFGFLELADDRRVVQFLWETVRGRHCFLVSVLCELVRSVGNKPLFKDVQAAVEKLQDFLCNDRTNPRSLVFRLWRIRDAPQIEPCEKQMQLNILGQMILWFEAFGQPIALQTTFVRLAQLMENSLCRFRPGANEAVTLSEPLVVRAYRKFYRNTYRLSHSAAFSSAGSFLSRSMV